MNYFGVKQKNSLKFDLVGKFCSFINLLKSDKISKSRSLLHDQKRKEMEN